MGIKILKDTKCSLDIALPQAVSAKDTSSDVYSFNPNHNYLIRRPPALEKVINNEILADNLKNAFLRYCSLNTRPKLVIVSVVNGD